MLGKLFARNEAIFRHSLHILLDDGLQFALHLGPLGLLGLLGLLRLEEVVLHQRIRQAIDRPHLLSVELQDMSMLDILVDAVQVIDSPGGVRRCRQQVEAEGDIRLVVAQVLEYRWHDVRLLGDGVDHADRKSVVLPISPDGS